MQAPRIGLTLGSTLLAGFLMAPASAPDCLAGDSIGVPGAFAAAPQCMKTWIDSLHSTDQATRQRARAALALVGGREAVDALRADYDRSRDRPGAQPDRAARHALINAMATTGSESDVAFLIEQLHLSLVSPPRDIAPWADVQAAAMTLGFLHATSARDALRGLQARAKPSTFVQSAATAALRMLDRPPCADTVAALAGRELLRIILACEPTFMYEGTAFRDGGQVWRYTDSSWKSMPIAPSDTSVRATVSATSVILVPSGDEAFVWVETWCGMLCGEGWTYRLRRSGREWRVIGATFNWVS